MPSTNAGGAPSTNAGGAPAPMGAGALIWLSPSWNLPLAHRVVSGVGHTCRRDGVRRTRAGVVVLVALAALTAPACAESSRSGNGRSVAPSSSTSSTPRRVTTGVTTSSPLPTTSRLSCPQEFLASLTEAQRVGQLFMVGEPLALPDDAALAAVKAQAVGGVILYGNSGAPLSTIRMLTDRIRGISAPAVPKVGVYISTDQEGGNIQQLSGPGFARIPTAVVQGTIEPTQLRADAQLWGNDLSRAGVNVDLAPVVDVVPSAFAAVNQPIGHFDRQLGSDPLIVAAHGMAIVEGLQAAGVGATLKHFPGLGRVVGNTDTTANVVDNVTTSTDPFLAPWAAGIRAGAEFVMISLATYRQIDPAHRAVFSSIVMKDILRNQLGFRGLIISDDLGAAQQVLDMAPGGRAVSFLANGGDIILVVKPAAVVATMVAAVERTLESDPAFRELVNIDVLAVLEAKRAAGLLTCP